MNQSQYQLYLSDGYGIYPKGIFPSRQKAQEAMQNAYRQHEPKEWLKEYEEISCISESDAILYANGEDVFVWYIHEIKMSDIFHYKNDSIVVALANGYLVATASQDVDHSGIEIEYVTNDDDGSSLSGPRVLIEQAKGEEKKEPVRCLIWNDPDDDDCSEEIELTKK